MRRVDTGAHSVPASPRRRSVLGSWVGARRLFPTFPYSYPRPAWSYPKILVLTRNRCCSTRRPRHMSHHMGVDEQDDVTAAQEHRERAEAAWESLKCRRGHIKDSLVAIAGPPRTFSAC